MPSYSSGYLAFSIPNSTEFAIVSMSSLKALLVVKYECPSSSYELPSPGGTPICTSRELSHLTHPASVLYSKFCHSRNLVHTFPVVGGSRKARTVWSARIPRSTVFRLSSPLRLVPINNFCIAAIDGPFSVQGSQSATESAARNLPLLLLSIARVLFSSTTLLTESTN